MILDENKDIQHDLRQLLITQPLFVSGQGGYHTYRIPALKVTNQGTVLAFCEGRKNDHRDSGEIDLLLKRSTDNGQTWSDYTVIWHDAGNTCGNPCVVIERTSGMIFLLATWNRGDDVEEEIIKQISKDTRRVFLLCSSDDGLTWSKPREITGTVKKEHWTWYATGPGSGIQIRHGLYKGRLVVPCDHIEAGTEHRYSHIIFSDDCGKNWELGGVSPRDNVNECEVVELTNDGIMLNMRSDEYRQTAVSRDGGATWRDQRFDLNLPDSTCQASIHCYQAAGSEGERAIIFCNPADKHERKNLTLRLSYDDAKTWRSSKLIYPGPAGYSDLAVLNDNNIACLYEAGKLAYFESIIFSIVPFLFFDEELEKK